MKEPRLEESPIDHHIQARILHDLFNDGGIVAFRDLKPDDVQNSLFMYHVHKLELRGLVSRSDAGFTLTPNGARWVNFVSPHTMKPRVSPRLLIKFFIFSEDTAELLLSKRRGAGAQHLNLYLLPSGLHKYGMAFDEAAALIIKSLVGSQPELKPLGVHETLHRHPDGYVHHVVSSLYVARLGAADFPEDDRYELLWVNADDVAAGKYGDSLAALLQWHRDGNSFAGKTFDFHE